MRCPDCSGALSQGSVTKPLLPGGGATAHICQKCKRFVVMCPGCGMRTMLVAPVERGPVGGQQAWVCLWCEGVCCEHCYWKHSTEKHGELYT